MAEVRPVLRPGSYHTEVSPEIEKGFIGQKLFKGHIADGAWFLHKAQVCAGVLTCKGGKGSLSLKKGEE